MKRRLIVRPEAELDIGDAASWYERERQGLGLRFIAELDRVLSGLVQVPTSSLKSSTVSGEGCCTAFLMRSISKSTKKMSKCVPFSTFTDTQTRGSGEIELLALA